MKCKLCGSDGLQITDVQDSHRIKKGYEDNFSIDVTEFFKDKEVTVWHCGTCGFSFFGDQALGGDSKFYAELEKRKWYYMPWKWEHEVCTDYIDEGQSVLEVGCANGTFIRHVEEFIGAKSVGLELNESSVEYGKKHGIDIRNEPIEVFSENHQGEFDLVCSFQVLEHIRNVGEFIKGQLECLKKGGTLVIGVPNNLSFFKNDSEDLLNMPPHHLSLWDEYSLTYLEKLFPIKLKTIEFEDLQDYHIDWYVRVLLNRVHPKLNFFLYRMKLSKVIRYLVKKMSHRIRGHTLVAIFEKI